MDDAFCSSNLTKPFIPKNDRGNAECRLYGMVIPLGSEDPRLIMREQAERRVDAELARPQPTDHPRWTDCLPR
jgi:hypothetical protein